MEMMRALVRVSAQHFSDSTEPFRVTLGSIVMERVRIHVAGERFDSHLENREV